MANSKKITYEDIWTGDFDGDGIPNMDDRRPFDKNKKSRVNSEVSLSQAFKNLKQRRKEYLKSNKDLIILTGASEGRVKGIYSTIGKQMGRNINYVQDMGGMRIYGKNRKDIQKKVREIKKTFPMCKKGDKQDCISEIDNKYTSVRKKSGVPYLGYHVNVMYKGKPHEIQIKCKKMQQYQDQMHPIYKSGDTQKLMSYRPKIMGLYRKGC